MSNEALALLLYKNNYDRWTDMGKNDNYKFSAVRPKYTSGGNACQTPKDLKPSSTAKKAKKGASKVQVIESSGNDINKRDSTCARYQGWSLEGIKKLNIFFDAVKAECASLLGTEFEEAFLQYSKDTKDNSLKNKRTKL